MARLTLESPRDGREAVQILYTSNRAREASIDDCPCDYRSFVRGLALICAGAICETLTPAGDGSQPVRREPELQRWTRARSRPRPIVPYAIVLVVTPHLALRSPLCSEEPAGGPPSRLSTPYSVSSRPICAAGNRSSKLGACVLLRTPGQFTPGSCDKRIGCRTGARERSDRACGGRTRRRIERRISQAPDRSGGFRAT